MGAPLGFAEKFQAGAGLGHLLTTLEVLETYPFEEPLGSALLVREPGRHNFGSIGNGSLSHLAMEAIAPGVAARLTMKRELIGHHGHQRLHGGVISAVLDVAGGFAIMLSIAGDAEINDLQIEIDDRCLMILALQNPRATDLRTITAAMKISRTSRNLPCSISIMAATETIGLVIE